MRIKKKIIIKSISIPNEDDDGGYPPVAPFKSPEYDVVFILLI
jgi:hypothetical protein